MKIKRLEMTGFKSFVDKTVIDLPFGITAVVGPNGCGKSNIVDAIRWVLGEQSYKNLRGKTMEDVIFNGSEGRSPTGMAEVIFTLDNSDGGIGGVYSSYSEISIGRRLFRSGESEYLLNRSPARLRDIQDIFLDTGVGSRAHYSIIEQGKVGLVLSAKPEERRTLIEEAAGISKFRMRKESALRKIESTKQNLLRITDVVAEVKRQIEYTRRQAQKARRHMEIRDKMQGFQGQIWRVDYREALQSLDALKIQLARLDHEEITRRAEISAMETQIEEIRLQSLEEEQGIRETQEKVFSFQGRIQVLERDIQHGQKMLADLAERLERAVPLMNQARDEVAVARGLLESTRMKLTEVDHQDETLQGELEAAEVELSQAQEQSSQCERQMETLREAINARITKMTSQGALLDNLDHRRIDLSKRFAGSEVEEEELDKRGSHLRLVLKKDEQKLEGLQQLQLELKTKSDEGRESIESLNEEKAKGEGEIFQIREHLTTLKSRLHVLQELQANYEGLHDGVRSIMLRQKEASENVGAGSRRGILGLVADLITLPKEYERAAEAALGDRLQYVVVKNHTEGVEAIDYLNAQAAGRSTFIPLHVREMDEASEGAQVQVQGEGVIGPMLSLVKADADYQSVVQYLFGNVVVVNNLDNALRIWSRNGNKRVLVTLNGEVLDPHGVVSGGRKGRTREENGSTMEDLPDSSSLLQRKRLIEDLKSEIQKVEGDLQSAEQQLRSLTQSLSHSKVQVETLQRDRHEEELKFVKQQKEIIQLREECERCDALLTKVRERKAEEERFLKEVQQQEVQIASTIRQCKEEKSQFVSELEGVKQKTLDCRSRTEGLKDSVLQMRVRTAELREQKANTQKEAIRLDIDIKEREERQERLAKDYERWGQEEKELQEKKSESEAEIHKSLEEMRILDQSLREKREVFQEKMRRTESLGEKVRESRKILDKTSQEVSGVRVDLAQNQMRLEVLENESPEGSPEYLQTLKEEVLRENVALSSEEIDQIRQELGELKGQLEGLGEVNLAAISELEELTERHMFLTRQNDDLQNSIDSLHKTIHKVERTTRERFRTTFDAVNQKFQEVFPRLFGGGKASLILTDENDLLTTGVDLLCQPPGKKIQNVTLLSGGEKALASICLILAIYLIKPSPFCLLDEVDAPLDDANISRFNELLHELAKESQLILITHNRHTMEIADYLYGVTMEEPGVSRMVSVRMN